MQAGYSFGISCFENGSFNTCYSVAEMAPALGPITTGGDVETLPRSVSVKYLVKY